MTWVGIQVQCQEEDLEPFQLPFLVECMAVQKTEALKVHKAVCGNTVNGQMQLLSGFLLALYKAIAPSSLRPSPPSIFGSIYSYGNGIWQECIMGGLSKSM